MLPHERTIGNDATASGPSFSSAERVPISMRMPMIRREIADEPARTSVCRATNGRDVASLLAPGGSPKCPQQAPADAILRA